VRRCPEGGQGVVNGLRRREIARCPGRHDGVRFPSCSMCPARISPLRGGPERSAGPGSSSGTVLDSTRPPEPASSAGETFSTAQLVRNGRYQQLAEGIERTDRRELERHQMGFAEWQLLQHGVRCLSVGHMAVSTSIGLRMGCRPSIH
jgi:hypothetical protein